MSLMFCSSYQMTDRRLCTKYLDFRLTGRRGGRRLLWRVGEGGDWEIENVCLSIRLTTSKEGGRVGSVAAFTDVCSTSPRWPPG